MSKNKITHVSLTLLAVVALMGCANTPDQIRQKPPRTYEAAKSAELVAACLIERYDGAGGGTLIEVTPRSDGGRTVKRYTQKSPPVYAYVADISPTSKGSITRFYENQLVAQWDRDWIQTCGTGKF